MLETLHREKIAGNNNKIGKLLAEWYLYQLENITIFQCKQYHGKSLNESI